MPTKRRGGDLAIPDITQDAAERKRVLNILAQRRYRKRKKDRMQSLQAQVEKQNRAQTAEARGEDNVADHHGLELDSSSSSETLDFLSLLSSQTSAQAFSFPDVQIQGLAAANNEQDPFAYQPPRALHLLPLEQEQEQKQQDPPNIESDLFSWPSPSSSDPYSWPTLTINPCNVDLTAQLQLQQSSTFTFPDDHIIEIPSLTLLNGATKIALRLNIAHILWDLSATSPFYTGPGKPGTESTGRGSSSSSSSSSSSPPPPSLTSSSAGSTPSECDNDNSSDMPVELDPSTLPVNLRPTPTQRLIPHHPILDVFPWPVTRDRLIQTFSLPPAVRPAAAQEPMALLRLVYDVEDVGGEGIRIRGADPFEPDGWEIGQVVFERWWWAFEVGVVERSDCARRERGENGLMLQGVNGK